MKNYFIIVKSVCLLLLLFSHLHLSYAMPTNDICTDAISIPVNGINQTFDITGSTASSNPTDHVHCGFLQNQLQNDVWFVVNVPNSGNLTLEVSEISGGASDLNMEVYEGTCSNLTPIACAYFKKSGNMNMPIVELEGLTSSVYYFRVVLSSGLEGQFQLKATDTPPSEFICKIDIVQPISQTTCDPLTNSFDQEVLIRYRSDGSATAIEFNDIPYPLTPSPMTLILPNIPANGGVQRYDLSLQTIGCCNCRTDSFTFIEDLDDKQQNCFSGTVTNDECSGAINLPVTSNCVESTISNLGATNSGVLACFGGTTGNQDIWYEIIVPPSGELIIHSWKLGNQQPYYAMYEGNCGNLSFIDCGDIFSSPRLSNRTPGEILYLQIGEAFGEFQGDIGVCAIDPVPQANNVCINSINIPIGTDCTEGFIISNDGATTSGNPTTMVSCAFQQSGTEDLWFNVVVPASGSINLEINPVVDIDPFPQFVIYEIFEGTCNQLNSILCDASFNSGPSISGRTPGETLYIKVVEEFMFSTKPYRICSITAVNDVCMDAIPLTVGNCENFSNAGASPSNNPTPALSCGETFDNDNDVWFQVTVPQSGNLTIQSSTLNSTNQFIQSISLEAYSGSCNSLSTLACSNFTERYDANIRDALIELENLTPNSIIYIRAADVNPVNDILDFELCVSDSGHTTHACKIQFIEALPPAACDPLTNTYSQDIVVHYYDDGSRTFLRVNNLDYPLLPSPMTLTIENLSANLNTRNIDAVLSGQFDECFLNSLYEKNNFFASVPNCFSGNVPNDNCVGAIPLTISDTDCKVEIYDMTGASGSSTTHSCSSLPTHFQDVWFSAVIPQNGELIIATSALVGPVIWTVTEVYEGNCQNLNLIESCVSLISSAHLSGRTPGETVYIRATVSEDFSGISQGPFGICAVNPQLPSENCSSAQMVSPSSECIPQVYSTKFANASLQPTETLSCLNSNGQFNQDIWFAVEVPNGGDLSITVEHVEDNPVGVELFESNCNNLSSLICQTINESQAPFIFTDSNRAPGEILYLRVMSVGFFDSTVFSLCVTADCPDKEVISYPINYQIEFEDHISITADNLIETGADVIYDGGQYVLLNAGFEVELNTMFHALIDGCN